MGLLLLVSACADQHGSTEETPKAGEGSSAASPSEKPTQCLLGTLPERIYTSTYAGSIGERTLYVHDNEEELKGRYKGKWGFRLETKKDGRATEASVSFNSEADKADQLAGCKSEFALWKEEGPLKMLAAPVSSATQYWNGRDGLESKFSTSVVWGCYGSCDLLK